MALSKEKTNVDILIVGKTGNGKSALGNIILQKKAFQSKNHTESVTKETQYDYSEFEGRIIKVVDGPGVGDTNKDKKKGLKIVVDAMSKAVTAHTDGFNAILIVGRLGVRFTEEEVKSIKLLKDIFGDAFIANHGILVMTFGDMFKIDEEESGETFEQWCQNQGGEFKELLTEVNNRVILFNNKEKEGKACNEQIRRLLHMIDGLSRDGTRYTSEIFAKAKLSRNRLISESKRPSLQEHTICEIGLITQQLDRIENLDPSEAMKLLESLETRSETLLQDVLEQDKGTKSLSAAIKVAESLKRAVACQLEQVKEVTDLQKKGDELEKKFIKEHQPQAKRKEEQQKQEKEEERKRKEEEEKRKREEEERRGEEERRQREENERIQKELKRMKNERERLEALRREEERREKERQEAERREEERRREEARREEQRRREDEEKRREKQREEERIQEEKRRREMEDLITENEGLKREKDRNMEIQVLRQEIEKDYIQLKKENSSSWWDSLGAEVGAAAWNYVRRWWNWS